jgi:thymidine phosphorylase
MFYLGGTVSSVPQGRDRAHQIISSGQALDRFRQMTEMQGGDVRVIDDPTRLPQARYHSDCVSSASGYVSAIQCEQVGAASVALGGGRERKEDSVDPAVGIFLHKKVGDRVIAGESLCTIHYNSDARLLPAKRLMDNSYKIAGQPPAKRAMIQSVIQGEKS